MYYKSIFLFNILFSLMFLSSCGNNNSEPISSKDSSTNISLYLINGNSVELSSNSQIVNIDIRGYDINNNPATGGFVKIIYPNRVKDGVDVGSFSSTEVELINGKASFIYTGPSNLNSLVDSGEISTTFSFYYEDDINNLKSLEFLYNPNREQIVNKTYSIDLFTSTEPINSINLKSSKIYSITISDTDLVSLDSSFINSMKITTLNASIGVLVDNNGKEALSLNYEFSNGNTFVLKSNSKSGIIPIKVEVDFIDINGLNQTLEEVFNVVVYSGPPTAISLSYIDVSKDELTGRFVDKWLVSVNDEYGNRVNTNPSISVGGIFGYKKDTLGRNIYVEPNSVDSANILVNSDNVNFETVLNLENVDEHHDKLVTFTSFQNSDGYTYEASGKWDFSKIDDNSLILLDNYFSDSLSGVGFAIGNNYRANLCKNGRESLGEVILEDSSNMLLDSGVATILVSYEPYLVGKDIMLWLNILGSDKSSNSESILRVGEAQKVTLKGMGLVTDECLNVSKNQNGVVVFDVYINETIPNIYNMLEPYENSNFNYEIVTTGTLKVNSVTSSLDYPINNRCEDYYSNYNTASWVSVNYSSNSEGGSICLDVKVAKEF